MTMCKPDSLLLFGGDYQHMLIYKLKQTKTLLKDWSKKLKKQDNVSKLQDEYNKYFLLSDADLKNATIYSTLMNINTQLLQAFKIQSECLMQKSKTLWLQEGVTNYKFFYSRMSKRRNADKIQALMKDNGDYVYNRDVITQESLDYFNSLFIAQTTTNFPTVQPRKLINDAGKAYLSTAIQMEEIKNAIDSIHDAKSPGPDGFSSKNFKLHWEDLKNDIFMAVSEVFPSGKLAKGLNHTFLTIIPKKEKPQTLADYRPIAYANVLYKIISKVLCNRLKHFLPFLIAGNQSAFIPGRNIGENVLLAHEMIRDFKKFGKPKCVSK